MRFNFSLLLLGSLILLLSIPGCGPTLHSKPGTTTTVILIRHVERDDYGRLTEAGKERALALVDAVGDMGITAIYSPNLERNLETVEPLARHLGIEVTLTPKVSMPMVGSISQEILTEHAGEVVLWVGNVSGNLQAIYSRLGGEGDGPLKYGQLYIIKVADSGPAQVEKTSFGAAPQP